MTEFRMSKEQQGIALVAFSCLWFGTANMLIKAIGPGVPAVQVAFLRSLLGFFPVAWVMSRSGIPFQSRHWPLLVLRGLSGLGAIVCFFWALVHVPIATAAMFNYTAPVFATVFAALFMGERLTIASGGCLTLAFGGMYVMLMPSFEGSPWPYAVALSAGVFSAASFIAVKRLTRDEPAWRIVLYFNATAAACTLPVSAWLWVWPSGTQWGLLTGVAAAATAGQMLMTAGFERGPVAHSSAATLFTVLVTALGGWLVFGQTLTGSTLAGMAAIAAGVLGLARLSGGTPVKAPQSVE